MTTRRGASRPLEWYTKDQSFTAIASAAQSADTLYSAAGEGVSFIKGATVTRMIIDVFLRAGSVAQLCRLFWGITIVSAEATAASAFPDVDDLTDRHDWLVRGRLMTIQDSLSDSSQWDRVHLDLRTQRVIRSEESELMFIVDAGSDGFAMEWAHFIRTLIRKP